MITASLAEIFDDLRRIRRWTCDQFVRAPHDKASPFRQPVFATADAQGAPHARHVILRAFDDEEWTFDIHTDVRAGKVAHIRAHPAATFVFWNPRSRVQVRVSGAVEIITEGAAIEDVWARLSDATKSDYAGAHPPGAEISAPDVAASVDRPRDNFALLRLQAETIDVLKLGRSGHRRAVFKGRVGDFASAWAAP